MFESFVKQVLIHLTKAQIAWPDDVHHGIKQFYKMHGLEADFEDVKITFSLLFKYVPNAIYVIDGLHELQRDEIFRVISSLQTLLQDVTEQKVFIASRQELGHNIRVQLQLHIPIVPGDIDSDIQCYIKSEISIKTAHNRILTENFEVIELMKRRLSEGAQGM